MCVFKFVVINFNNYYKIDEQRNIFQRINDDVNNQQGDIFFLGDFRQILRVIPKGTLVR